MRRLATPQSKDRRSIAINANAGYDHCIAVPFNVGFGPMMKREKLAIANIYDIDESA